MRKSTSKKQEPMLDVRLRLPVETMNQVRLVAKLSGQSVDVTFSILLASALVASIRPVGS